MSRESNISAAPQTSPVNTEVNQTPPKDDISLLEEAIKEVSDESQPTMVAALVKSIAMKEAQKLGVPPDVIESALSEFLSMLNQDEEMKKYLKALKLASLTGISGGETTEKVKDIVASKLVLKAGKKLEKLLDKEDGDVMSSLMSRFKRDLVSIMYLAETMKLMREMLKDEDDGVKIANAIRSAIDPLAKSISDLQNTLKMIHDRMNQLEERIRKVEEEKKESAFEKAINSMIEEIRSWKKEHESRIEELEKKLEELHKRGSVASGLSMSPDEALDWLFQNIEKLKKFGITIVTPEERIKELEQKLRELEQKGGKEEEKKKILEEIEKLKKGEYPDKDIMMKKMEIEMKKADGFASLLKEIGRALGDVIRDIFKNPSKLRELVEAFSAVSYSSGSSKPVQQPSIGSMAPSSPSNINIPSIDSVLGEVGAGSGKSDASTPLASTGEARAVREASASWSGGGAGEGVSVQRRELRGGDSQASGGSKAGDSGGDAGGGKARVQG